jgi:1-phosphofructokinase family hexose kinase
VILTITPNPSIDLLYEAETLVWDDANRVEMPRRRAGGQGINLTRAARVLGAKSDAVAFFGGHTGNELRALLDQDAINYFVVPIKGETRLFVAVRETSTGRSMLVNPRGPILNATDGDALLAEVEKICVQSKPAWVVCCGSLPRGLPEDFYCNIGKIAHANNGTFIADCDGAPLEHAVRFGCDLITPNQFEAERLVGQPVIELSDAVQAARELLGAASQVLIKLGERGAVLANANGCWHADGRDISAGSAVGAGDAFLAAFLAADLAGEPPQNALRSAVAAGGAVLLSEGSELMTRADYEDVLADVKLLRL